MVKREETIHERIRLGLQDELLWFRYLDLVDHSPKITTSRVLYDLACRDPRSQYNLKTGKDLEENIPVGFVRTAAVNNVQTSSNLVDEALAVKSEARGVHPIAAQTAQQPIAGWGNEMVPTSTSQSAQEQSRDAVDQGSGWGRGGVSAGRGRRGGWRHRGNGNNDLWNELKELKENVNKKIDSLKSSVLPQNLLRSCSGTSLDQGISTVLVIHIRIRVDSELEGRLVEEDGQLVL